MAILIHHRQVGTLAAELNPHHRVQPLSFVSHPGGMPAISRGLSGAIPPEHAHTNVPIPEGSQPWVIAPQCSFDRTHPPGWHPSGMHDLVRTVSGGVAPLNPRLMAFKPPAWCTFVLLPGQTDLIQVSWVILHARLVEHLD